MNLYSTHAKNFSATRQAPWRGWTRLIEHFNQLRELEVLDLGCGNGRFLEFLIDKAQKENTVFKLKSYVGIDSSEEMLEIAGKRFITPPALRSLGVVGHPLPTHLNGGQAGQTGSLKERGGLQVEFLNADLDSNESLDLKQKFNLIVAFGLIHHLESNAARERLIDKSKNLLRPGGILIITFWQFGRDEDFLKKHVIKELGDNDFILSFDKEAERFCHFSNDEEIQSLISGSNLEFVEGFYADGKSGRMNRYIILKG